MRESNILRAYGDREGDGMVQMTFTLAVLPGDRARSSTLGRGAIELRSDEPAPMRARLVAEATESVRDGKRLSEPLSVGGFIPEQILAMITVAEESNKLHEVLVQIADTVERRTNRQVDQAVRLIEPVILCAVAAAIGFLALGLLLPIFTMASALGSK